MLDILNQVSASMTAPDQMFAITETKVRGNKMKTWANAPESLRDIWLESTVHGEKDYLVFQDERWTYSKAHDEVTRIVNWLTANGIGQHDRVGIAMRNYPEWILSYWAIVSIGAVVVGLNAWWVAEELKHGLTDSKVKMLICDQKRLELFTEIKGTCPTMHVVAVRTNEVPEFATSWDEALRAEPDMPEVKIDTDDDVCILYTSGTTGFPKGAQLTHRSCVNQLFSAMFASISQNTALRQMTGGTQSGLLNPSAPTAGLITTPLFHVTANAMTQALTIGGGKVVLMYKWGAGEALGLIEREKITGLVGAPTMGRELISHPDFEKHDITSLATLAGGGAPVQPDLLEKITSTAGSVMPAEGYGLTETSGIVSGGYGEFLTRRPSSAGLIVPVCEVKTVDKEGNDLDRDEIGEICVYGPHIVKGYLDLPEATAETIVDGWLHTGDIGFVDEDNYLYIVDRSKDMVLRGGENVYCTEVEAAIYDFPGIAECAVFSIPDERLGEEVGAAIFMGPGIGNETDVEPLRKFLRVKLAAFKRPRYIWVVDHTLPKNASGKIVKRELQKTLDTLNAHC